MQWGIVGWFIGVAAVQPCREIRDLKHKLVEMRVQVWYSLSIYETILKCIDCIDCIDLYMYWPPFHPSLLHLAQPCGPSNSCATQHWTDQWSIHSIHQQTYSIALTVTSPLKWLPDCCWVDTVLHTSAIEYASFIIKGNKVHKNGNSQGSRRFTRVLFVCHLSMMIRVTVMSMSSPLDTLASTLFPAWQDLDTKFLICGNFCRCKNIATLACFESTALKRMTWRSCHVPRCIHTRWHWGHCRQHTAGPQRIVFLRYKNPSRKSPHFVHFVHFVRFHRWQKKPSGLRCPFDTRRVIISNRKDPLIFMF